MTFDQPTFSTRFRNLINLLDNEHNLTHDVRIHMYEELLKIVSNDDILSVLMLNDVLKSLRLYCEELASSNNYRVIYRFEDSFSKWMHIPSKTVYHNPQNVHVFMTPAARAAKEIMSKHPCKYNRPFDHAFFKMIETDELVNGIHMPSLFASVWLYITTHDESEVLRGRLLEEMNESEDMCLSGHMVRLVNSVKGFDDVFEFNLEQYEYDKARIFNQLNRLLDVTMLDNLLKRMQDVVNGDNFDRNGIGWRDMIKILKDYSKHEWTWVDNKFICLL